MPAIFPGTPPAGIITTTNLWFDHTNGRITTEFHGGKTPWFSV
jgi:hypothetical protein